MSATGYRFVVPGAPQGKGRHRTGRTRDGSPVHYTPDATAVYERTVAWAAKGAGVKPIEGPVAVRILAYFQIPTSWSKRKQQDALDGNIVPTVKPDGDNIAKAICDALNGIAYRDDAQVAQLVVEKLYSDEPRVHVTIIHISK